MTRMTVEAAQPVVASRAAPAPPLPGRTRRAVMTWTAGAFYSATTVLVGFVATLVNACIASVLL